ncbi:MAG: sulfurtransferase [Chloroflexi bacterium]|nr:sulfurtransferase [Chloroflexota bacterium]
MFSQGSERGLPGLLVDTDWLYQHLHDPKLRVVDTGPNSRYADSHVPGAINIPHNYIKDANDSTHVMPPGQFADIMGRLGISDDTHVIAYDDNDSLHAARLWWVLDYYGHSHCSVLDGGWVKWLAEGRPVSTEVPAFSASAPFTPVPNPDVFCSIDHLKGCVGNEGTIVWDVRSWEEHTGENPRSNKRAGHVPGAVHMEWRDVIDPETHTFRPIEEIRPMLLGAGITPDKEVITH